MPETSQPSDLFLSSALDTFRSQKQLAEKAISQLSDEQLRQPLDENTNSVAVIMKHVAGNLRSRWTDFLTTDGEKPWRKRDGEFVDDFDSRETLMEFWNTGWRALFVAVESLRESDLTKTVFIRGEPHSVMKTLSRSSVSTMLFAFLAPLIGCNSQAPISETDWGTVGTVETAGTVEDKVPEQHSSPEEVFEAARDAAGKEDWAAYCNYLSTEGKTLLAQILLQGALFKDRTSGFTSATGESDRIQDTLAVLDKYGFRGKQTSAPDELRKMLAEVPSIETFIVEMLAAEKKADKISYPPLVATATLKDLHDFKNPQTGEAQVWGTIVQTRNGKTQEDSAIFENTDGGWKMNFVYIPTTDR